jgi:hypothetical protein
VPGENGNRYISAAYSGEELVTSVVFEWKKSSSSIEVTKFSVEEVGGKKYLNVNQEIFGLGSNGTHRMNCHLPAQ